MELLQVNNFQTAKDFLQVAVTLYKKDANWIRPLNKDINDVFNQKKNKAFRTGQVMRWILKDEKGNLIGRIAAFVQKKYKNKGDDIPVGGIGFFECINNQQAADMLFDVAKHWLMQKGMQAMDGPINFGERDRWWGLVTEGFKPPIYLMNYNPPYYQALFENYGFRVFYNQLCWHLHVQHSLPEKFFTQHEKYVSLPEFSVNHIRKNNLKKFAADFCTVYNKAWAGHEGNKEMNKEMALKIFKAMKPVMDETLIWFAYHKDEPIAMWVNLPDLNQIVKYLNGQFNFFSKLKFLWLRYRKACKKFTGIVYGIVPEFQGTGIDYFMIVEGAKVIQRNKQYDELELQWQGDFNPKMLNISKNLGATQSRNLATYRYLFDRTKEFKRHPIL
ncbi:MAG TPA: hypothetical protein VFN30_02965 [Chitinophagaceae bacterium]|nr:hypothetical protein [Chitinophagaceae bacterium]